jgi:hypothetical protein
MKFERLVDHRSVSAAQAKKTGRIEGELEFLVVWKGWPDQTWETEETLRESGSETVDIFLRDLEAERVIAGKRHSKDC